MKKAFLLDLDGTIYLGDQLLPGAKEFILNCQEKDIPYLFLTNNSSKAREDYLEKLNTLGIPATLEDIYTSGTATIDFLKGKDEKIETIFLLGTDELKREFQKDFILTEDPEKADELVLAFDTTIDYKKLWKAQDFILKRGSYIATHPDLVCPLENGKWMPDIGCMIDFLEACTGIRPTIIGKPNKLLVETVKKLERFSECQLYMVGDRLYTDIKMAIDSNIQSCLVLTGEATKKDALESSLKIDYLLDSIGDLIKIL